MNNVRTLLIADSRDYTTDFVCVELERRNESYLRMDRDKFAEYKIDLDLNHLHLTVEKKSIKYCISELALRSIYYRAPTFLRETFSRSVSPSEQLYASQWMAFVRNLTVFEKATWVNNPVATYKAENKLYQLISAKKRGLDIPETRIINYCDNYSGSENAIVVKSLDTAILRIGEDEGFVYSNVIHEDELKNYNLSIAPIILQEYLNPKIDWRVTVIGETVYSVKIMRNNSGVEGDWRKLKNNVDFVPVSLPANIARSCVELVKDLGLSYGGLDLIEARGTYYFIEINPTGEWAWLVNSSNLPIYEGICDFLMR